MRVCVLGAGAVGGLIGARLAAAGHETSAVARGGTLDALREHGWRLDGQAPVPVRATDEPAGLGAQDLVVLAVKAPALTEVAARIGPLLGAETVVLPAMNGVPWWFLPEPLRSVDPHGTVASSIPRHHVVGCVVHFSSAVTEPGMVRHVAGDELIIGEPDGDVTPRVEDIAKVLTGAGFRTHVSADVRVDVWYKLWGNLTMNPISALTGATADRILDDPLVNQFCLAVMAEAAEIGARIGCPIAQSGTERMAVTRKLGAFKTSMLQDTEAGRPIELDALVSAVHEIGERVGVPTPAVDTLLGLTRLSARVRGLYPPAT